jgi:hypothetical protein
MLSQKTAAQAEKSDDPLVAMIGPIMGGMMILYAFYTGTATAESILRKKKSAPCRLFTTPTPQSTILSGNSWRCF